MTMKSLQNFRRSRIAAALLAGACVLFFLGTHAVGAQSGVIAFYCYSQAEGGTSPTQAGDTPCSTGDSGSYSTTQTYGIGVNGGIIFFPFTEGFGNDTQGAAKLAVLQSSATATATTSPAYFDYTNDEGETAQFNDPLIIQSASSTQVASNTIDFTVGGTLPHGTLVQYRLTLNLQGGATASPCIFANDSSLTATLYANVNASTNTGGQGISIVKTGCEGTPFNSSPAILSTVAGASFSLGASLLAAAQCYAGYPPPPIYVPFVQNCSANAGATMTFYLDPITPGATYIDSAGVVNGYLTPPSTVDVPNVVGDTQSAATSALLSTGLIVGNVTFQPSHSATVGTVLSEDPVSGASVSDGSPVALVISSGVPQITVPNVVGDSQAAAASSITGAGLTLAAVTTENNASIPLGDVISESPGAGTSVATGSSVSLIVSSGRLRGDINGDGQINSLDLALITAVLNTPANGPADPRDLNHDGLINMLDARILVTLCTHPGCAIN
jgi:hypothetical protein